MVRAGAVNRQQASVLAVLSAMALVVLDAGLINVALPVMGSALKTTPAKAVLAVSAYQAALLVGLLPSAQIADRFGQRRLFVLGLSLFTVASVACGLAGSLAVLVAARFVQGLGGATIMALGVALLRDALGSERLGQAIGWNAMTVALCSAAGPILGGSILSIASWPWLFFAKLPISLVALLASAGLPPSTPKAGRLDAPGLALHACAALFLLLAVAAAKTRPGAALLLGCVAAAAAVLLLRRQKASAALLWPVDLLGRRPVRIAAAASVCCFMAQSLGLLALPFQLQLGLGRGLLGAGVVMTCWPMAVAVTSSVSNPLAEKFGSARLCAAGGLILGLGLLISAASPLEAGVAPLAAGAGLCGLGFGLFQTPNNRTLFLCAPPERSAAAGGMQGSARLIGQALGALVMGLLLAGGSAAAAARTGFGLAAGFAVAAALISALALRSGRRGTAPTPRRTASPPAPAPGTGGCGRGAG